MTPHEKQQWRRERDTNDEFLGKGLDDLRTRIGQEWDSLAAQGGPSLQEQRRMIEREMKEAGELAREHSEEKRRIDDRWFGVDGA